MAVASGRTALDEAEAKRLFATYGIAVPAGELVHSEAAAADAARRLGGRLAMKAVGSAIHHKTEGGLVVLDIAGPEAAVDTYRTLVARAAGQSDGILVEQMVPSNRELMVGMKRDPMFGPVVAFGLGGVLTEVLADVALALAPVDDREAEQLPDLIRGKRLLGSFRGYPPVDRACLAGIIQAIGQIALDFPEIAEIDVNPLLVIDGDRPVAADALVVFNGSVSTPAPAGGFRPQLDAVLAPRSVAIIGASDDVSKWGGSVLRNILDGRYTGAVYPVNPKGGVYFGQQVYASLDDLPEAPDLALLAVGSQHIKAMLEACGRRGVRAAVAIAAGFSETGEQGALMEREIADAATQVASDAHRAELHGARIERMQPPRHGLHRVASGRGEAELRVSVGKHRHPDRQRL